MAEYMERTELIRFYFNLGVSYQDILDFLAQIHGTCLSMRTLKRELNSQGLFRRRLYTDHADVAQYIETQIRSSGNQHGYRWMHLKCVQEGMTVSRSTVHALMQILDPVGVELRQRRRLRRRQYFGKGPDFIWHVDSYDKLKHYGLCINGCIDGYSRHIIWLNVYTTSSNPRVIAGYYMEAIRMRDGFPRWMRGDMGTENGHVAEMQAFLTGNQSFLYGRSTGNQRIESFWNFLKKQCCQFWIDMLSILKDEGHFTGSLLDTNLIQFAFMKLLQDDIDGMVHVWNTHVIRPSKNQNSPSGRPIVLYNMSTLYGTRSYLQPVMNDQIAVCSDHCIFRARYPCDEDVYNLSVLYMADHGWEAPTTAEEAMDLYCKLRVAFLTDL